MSNIYLDYNATSPVRPEVLEVMLPFYREKFGNPSSVHWAGRQVSGALEKAREQVAALILHDETRLLTEARWGMVMSGRVNARGRPLGIARLAVDDVVEVRALRHPAIGHVRQVNEEVRRQLTFAVREDTMLAAAMVHAEDTHAADEDCHLGSRQSKELRAIEHHLFGAGGVFVLFPVAEPVRERFEMGKTVSAPDFVAAWQRLDALRLHRDGDGSISWSRKPFRPAGSH